MPRQKKPRHGGNSLPESRQTVNFKLPYSIIDNIRKLSAGEKHQFSGKDDDDDDLSVVGCHLNDDYFSLSVIGGKKQDDVIRCTIRDVHSSSSPDEPPTSLAQSGQTEISIPEDDMFVECKREPPFSDTSLTVVTSDFVTACHEHEDPESGKEENFTIQNMKGRMTTRRSGKRQMCSSPREKNPSKKSKPSCGSNDTKKRARRASKSREQSIKEEKTELAENRSMEHNESSNQLKSEPDDNSSKTDPNSGRQSKLAAWISAHPLFEFRCKICPFEIQSRSEFLAHLRSHDKTSRQYISEFNVDTFDLTTVRDQDRFQCEMCGASFLDLEILVKHTNNIHKYDPRRKEQLIAIHERRWSQVKTGILQNCPYCDKTYAGRRIMSHLKLVHPDEPDFEEKLRKHTVALDKEKSKKQNLARKNAKNDAPKPLGDTEKDVVCPYCAKQTKPRYLPRHIKLFCKETVRDRRVYKCPCCEFRTYEMTEWQKHKATEHERLLVCEVCGKSLGSKSSLSHHIRFKHGILNKKPLSFKTCPVCCKSFETKSQLDRHMPTHSNYRAMTECECSICGHVVRDKGGLHKHMQQVHRNIYPHYCPKCGHGVKNRQKLRAHRCGRIRRKNHSSHIMDDDKRTMVESKFEEPNEVTENCLSGEVAVKAETTDLPGTVYIQQVQSGNEATVNIDDVEYDSYILLDEGSDPQTNVITVEVGSLDINQSEYSVVTAAAAVEFVDG